MYDDENSNVIMPTVCALAVLGLIGVGFFFFFNSRPVSVSVPAPVVTYSPAPVADHTTAPRLVVRVIADAGATDRTAELQYDGKTYAPDEAGFAELVKDLEASSDGSGVSLVCDASLSTDSVMKVMGAIILSQLKGPIALASEPADPAKVAAWMKGK